MSDGFWKNVALVEDLSTTAQALKSDHREAVQSAMYFAVRSLGSGCLDGEPTIEVGYLLRPGKLGSGVNLADDLERQLLCAVGNCAIQVEHLVHS
jgi:hypothetical protein